MRRTWKKILKVINPTTRSLPQPHERLQRWKGSRRGCRSTNLSGQAAHGGAQVQADYVLCPPLEAPTAEYEKIRAKNLMRNNRIFQSLGITALGMMETCQLNKENRFEVKFHQKTGSRPYISHVHALKEARKGEELTLFDLFKECHNGKKTDFSEPVKKAIASFYYSFLC
ncbi:hypothetical protein TRIUR3_25511 [Triticum urartu]|uniref:Uncharacterized protein n=1 Tax=Triticum urartu TaxID=4572 RepID=M8ANE7_TRIUA|nr:hypothetical protein TRIUR3_25511 [Triticum urartu]